jgi:glutathione S-transferase
VLKLHGFSASNYYNVVKLALLEKGLEFEEVLVYAGAGPKYRPDYLEMSPLGKVPCLETQHGFISESRCILAYIDASHPAHGPALFPGDAFERAKHDELYQVLELYLELAARRLLPSVLGRAPVHDVVKRDVKTVVDKGLAAVLQLARFAPFMSGATLRAVDLAAAMHFPVVSMVMKAVYGEDPLVAAPIAEFMAAMEQRPFVQQMRREAAADFAPFRAHLATLYARP